VLHGLHLNEGLEAVLTFGVFLTDAFAGLSEAWLHIDSGLTGLKVGFTCTSSGLHLALLHSFVTWSSFDAVGALVPVVLALLLTSIGAALLIFFVAPVHWRTLLASLHLLTALCHALKLLSA